MRIAVNHVSLNIPIACAMCLAFCTLAYAQPSVSQPKVTAKPDLQNASATAPQTVYVAVSRAEIFSGPSEDAYPTSHVERGNALEVYHRTKSGWLGIRPPEKSFSWVPASDAYLLPGGRVIEITNENAISWIGTELGSAKQYRWQVKLSSGEQLAVLDEMTKQDSEGREVLWYKVAPPSGEFRWIQEKAVSTTAIGTGAGSAKPLSGQATNTTASPKAASPKAAVKPAAAARDQRQTSSEVKQAGFSQDVFADEQIIYDSGEFMNGEIIDGEYVDGGYSDGSYVEGEYYEGEYIDGNYIDGGYVDGGYVEGSYADGGDGEVYQGKVYVDGLPVRSSNSFHGWHALELTDEGFRSPFLERRYRENRARAASDPLNYDPFDLSMARKASPPPRPVQTVVSSNIEPSTTRRNTPWRDPRSLRQNRLEGYPPNRLSANETRPSETPSNQSTGLLGQLASSVTRLAETTSQSETAEATLAPKNTWFGVDRESPGYAMPSTTQPAAGVGTTELNDVQLSLSAMVSQPMPSWNLGPLVKQTQYVIEHGATPVERGQARLLLERIEEFELLARKSGYGGGSVITASLAKPSGSSPVSTASAGYSGALNPSAGEAGFDATGWLVPVHAASVGQPTHAITNDAGQTIAYVTGLPGMNLERYVNQPVGISGLRGYLPALQANHIQAQRVVRLR